jgi:penicillin-binding protein 2
LHDHAWFTAYAPYEDPKLVVTIILENAGGGSSNAAPIARQIMDFYLNKRLPQIEHQQNTEEKAVQQPDLQMPPLESQPGENE